MTLEEMREKLRRGAAIFDELAKLCDGETAQRCRDIAGACREAAALLNEYAAATVVYEDEDVE